MFKLVVFATLLISAGAVLGVAGMGNDDFAMVQAGFRIMLVGGALLIVLAAVLKVRELVDR